MKIDISSSVAEKGLDSIKGFLQKLVGPSVDEVGLLFADNVRIWRLKNQVRLLSKVEELIREKRIETKRISLKVLLPLLEASSLEEDEALHDKWCALLLNYVDASQSQKSTVFPYILSQLSSLEASILEFVGQKNVCDYYQLHAKFQISDAELSNLIRLGLIRDIPEVRSTSAGYYDEGGNWFQDIYSEVTSLETTGLGNEFLKACTFKLD